MLTRLLTALFIVALALNASAGQVDLSWTPNTESDLGGYRIYSKNSACDGNPIPGPYIGQVGTVTAFTYQVPNSVTTVCAAITAIDTPAGNESAQSLQVTKSFTPQPESLPLLLEGTTPESATTSVTVTKPASSPMAHVALTVFDMDNADEGNFTINGHAPIQLFGAQHLPNNDATTETFRVDVDPSWFVNGANTFVFTHTATMGFRILAINVTFDPPADTTPPAQPTGLRIVQTTALADGMVVALRIEVPKSQCPLGVDTIQTGSTTTKEVRTVRCKPITR